ncbi:MAG TPA: biotin carboxylase N-terminal domain-containing protein, partial [Rhizomicrobium sp.]|nr:biotin carboxylase N-terminal domain-containing protein [Rhizomicrobium sp.]
MKKILIANRGEIAIRIAATAAGMGIATVAIFPEDDSGSLHTRRADEARVLPGAGAGAYLDQAAIVAAARETGCDAVHPGCGFLSERADFARACAAAGLIFIGPAPETLELFGDKARARDFAKTCGVTVLPGTEAATLEDVTRFFAQHGPIMLKAVGGGGGRGMRLVREENELAGAYERCRSEAKSAFGSDAVYAEKFLPNARHIEVQIAGDGKHVVQIGTRECSIQRRHQKIVEIAPALGLPERLQQKLLDAAVKIGKSSKYQNLGTIEFLVGGNEFAFIEANPRLQVEHTVTEEVTGLDLVRMQIGLADGGKLPEIPEPRGIAVQLRINMETMSADG